MWACYCRNHLTKNSMTKEGTAQSEPLFFSSKHLHSGISRLIPGEDVYRRSLSMKVCCICIFCHKKKSLAKNIDYSPSFTIRGEEKVRLRHKKHLESRVRGNLKPVVLDASLQVPNIVFLLCSCELGYGPLNTRLSPNTNVLTSYTCGACCCIDHSRAGKIRLSWFVLLF